LRRYEALFLEFKTQINLVYKPELLHLSHALERANLRSVAPVDKRADCIRADWRLFFWI